MVFESLNPQSSHPPTYDTREERLRVRLRIPAEYRQDPILSIVITQYGLTVNILAAQLSNQASDGGWFDLEVQGPSNQINNGILHLNDLGIEMWRESDSLHEGW